MKIFLTGRPGVGKSSVFLKIIEKLKDKKLKIGGITTPEIREIGKRTGFKVIDLFSGKEGILATTKYRTKFRLGKYFVDVENFEKVAIPALNFALKECDIIAIDEVGKMEFYSEKFKEILKKILDSDKTLIAVVHRAFTKKFAKHGIIFEVNYQNRNKLHEQIIKLLKLCR
jgi:nucleoside-triphosphatase